MKSFMAMFMLVFLAGCNVVVSTTPFGLKPVCLHSEHIIGTWENEGEEACRITVHDQTKALIDVSVNEASTPNQPKWRTVRAHLMCGNKWHFFSIPMAEDGSPKDGYLFACYSFTLGRICVWMPDFQKFKKLVEAGTIPGRIEKGQIYLKEVTPKLIDMIESEEHGLLFDWQRPFILQKKKEAEKLNNQIQNIDTNAPHSDLER